MEAANTEVDNRRGTRLEASPEGPLDNQVLQQSQLPWAAWLFEHAGLTSRLSTSSKRKMLVINLLR